MTDPDDDDAIAAEYALGTLNVEERVATARRRTMDTAFDATVTAWETRLSPLMDSVPEVEPPANLLSAVWHRIGLPALDATVARAGGNVVVLTRSVQRWRRATAAVSALAACLALVLVAGALRETRPSPSTLVAFLEKPNNSPAYLINADLQGRTLAVKPVAAQAPAGRSYELWIIDPALGAPRSLGVLDAQSSRRPLPAAIPADVIARATYAVTEEQAGGSPNGAPSGSPIYVGHLVSNAF